MLQHIWGEKRIRKLRERVTNFQIILNFFYIKLHALTDAQIYNDEQSERRE